MRLLEARDGFLKIELEGKIPLSSFIEVSDDRKTYVAQIIQIKRGGNTAIAYAKIHFQYDGTLKDYDKTLPDSNFQITEFPIDIIKKSLKNENPVVLGRFSDEIENLITDETFFANAMLICIDNYETKSNLLLNIQKQTSKTKNTLIIDTTGKIDGDKYVAGVDFKIPLNTDSLAFLYEDCLNDATGDSKIMIKSIFQELSEYSKTVGFLPFSALKNIIDDMVEKAHVFKLIVLKNKLSKFEKLGYFASTQDEANKLEEILSRNAIIDLSKLEPVFLNRYFSSIYKILNSRDNTSKVLVEVSNNINKNNLKEIVMNKKVESVFVTTSKFKYINDLKSMFTNFIIEPSFVNSEFFSSYKTFLTSMPQDTLLVAGESTNNLPFVFVPEEYVQDEELNEISVKDSKQTQKIIINTTKPEDSTSRAIDEKSEQFINKVSKEMETSGSGLMANIFTENSDEDSVADEETDAEEIPATSFENEKEFHTEIVTPENTEELSAVNEEKIETDEEISTINEPEEIDTELNEIVEPTIIENTVNEDTILTDIAENESLDEISEETESVIEDNDTAELIQEFESSDIVIDENTAIEDYSDSKSESNQNINEDETATSDFSDEDLEKEIIADVDSIYTSIKDDSLSDSDLDIIDELNSEDFIGESDNLADKAVSLDEQAEELLIEAPDETLTENFEPLEEIQEEQDDTILNEPIQEFIEKTPSEDADDGILQTKEGNTPIVPVYSADIPQEDTVMSDEIYQGDTVTHAKYGTGVVEKMIKYGTKTLCSINFDNVGRRLLDPTMTEIKKN